MPSTGKKREMSLAVSMIRTETPDIKTFRFDLGPEKPFPFLPGQFVILSTELWNPKKNRMGPVNRAFSIASSPLESDYIEVAVKRYPNGRMTHWLHDHAKVGQAMKVKGPQGDFIFREGETDELVLIAGGIGVAPYRSIVRTILERKLPVRVRLFYSARTPADFAYREEFESLAGRYPNFSCLLTVTREHAGWEGRVGRLDESLFAEPLENPRSLYYLCGPDTMIRQLRTLLQGKGAAPEAVRSERW
jgi:ferredoxin-NADP reductase